MPIFKVVNFPDKIRGFLANSLRSSKGIFILSNAYGVQRKSLTKDIKGVSLRYNQTEEETRSWAKEEIFT